MNYMTNLTSKYAPGPILQSDASQTNNQLRTSSNTQNQATIQDSRVVVQNVQEQQNHNQRYFARGNGTTGNGGAQNSAGNANAGQVHKLVSVYRLNRIGHIARNCTRAKASTKNSDNFQGQDCADQSLREWCNEWWTLLIQIVDDDRLLSSIFSQFFLIGLANPQAGPSDASILSEVHILENAIDHINDISGVPSCASSALNSVCVFPVNDAFVPHDPIATELKIYKEQVAIYEQHAKFELTEREHRMDDQMRMLIQNRNKTEENLKKELHSFKLQLKSTMENNKIIEETVVAGMRSLVRVVMRSLECLARLGIVFIRVDGHVLKRCARRLCSQDSQLVTRPERSNEELWSGSSIITARGGPTELDGWVWINSHLTGGCPQRCDERSCGGYVLRRYPDTERERGAGGATREVGEGGTHKEDIVGDDAVSRLWGCGVCFVSLTSDTKRTAWIIDIKVRSVVSRGGILLRAGEKEDLMSHSVESRQGRASRACRGRAERLGEQRGSAQQGYVSPLKLSGDARVQPVGGVVALAYATRPVGSECAREVSTGLRMVISLACTVGLLMGVRAAMTVSPGGRAAKKFLISETQEADRRSHERRDGSWGLIGASTGDQYGSGKRSVWWSLCDSESLSCETKSMLYVCAELCGDMGGGISDHVIERSLCRRQVQPIQSCVPDWGAAMREEHWTRAKAMMREVGRDWGRAEGEGL
ncbi:hypothetical protein Tco_0257681 [Tanacetum coccineum]